jgi:hypothetical protein
MIQYSRDIGDIMVKPRRTGYPACAGYDGYLLSAGIYRHCRSIHFSNSAASSHNFAISPRVSREVLPLVPLSEIRGRRECRTLDASAAARGG